MKLSTFILDNLETTLQEWENFAKTIFPEPQNTKTLRDHAKQMLLTIAKDLEQTQSKSAQTAKSKGLQPLDKKNTPAKEHGSLRMEEGFSINEMVSEYRALRASVTKLWGNANKKIKPSDMNDLIRFNEAIDQALSQSVISYSSAKEKQSRLFETMLSSSPDLSYILDLEGNFLYLNKAMLELYKKPAHALLGKALYNFTMPTPKEIQAITEYIIETGGQRRGQVMHQSSSGIQYFEYVYAPVFDKKKKKVEAIAGASRNITNQKTAEGQIWQNANYDFLTGLANRRLFRDRLEHAIKVTKRSNEPLALLFIDLDRFKEVNDELGHDAGDTLLKQTANRIRACVRETDTITRMGGDEFTIILVGVRENAQAKNIAEKLLSDLRKPFEIKGQMVRISASVGITLFPKNGSEPDTLVGNADRAMYAAKKAGRDQLKFYSNELM